MACVGMTLQENDFTATDSLCEDMEDSEYVSVHRGEFFT